MSVIPYTNIVDGQFAAANDINSRFGDVLAQVNGNLDSSNIKKGGLTRDLFASDALLAAWPIGSVYISVNNTDPSTTLGGQWVRFATGRTLVGFDDTQTEFDAVEKEGGHKSLQAHTHSVNPPATNTSSSGSHSHSMGRSVAYSASSTIGLTGNPYKTNDYTGGNFSTASAGSHTHSVNIPAFNSASAGSGNAQNLQPYIVTYMWKRVS